MCIVSSKKRKYIIHQQNLNDMKKITLILTVFIFILSAQSYAQEVSPELRSVDQVDYDNDNRDIERAKKGKKNKAHKKGQHIKRAEKRKLRAMRKVAKADGEVTPNEKKMIRSEKRKMKRNGKRRAHERRKDVEKTSTIEPRRN